MMGRAYLRSAGRRAMARLLVIALLLPTLLGLLPALPLSAEAALAQAAMQSLCTEAGPKNPGHPPAGHDQHCILCSAGCCAAQMGSVPTAHTLIAWRQPQARRLHIECTSSAESAPPWRSIIVPRAPPRA